MVRLNHEALSGRQRHLDDGPIRRNEPPGHEVFLPGLSIRVCALWDGRETTPPNAQPVLSILTLCAVEPGNLGDHPLPLGRRGRVERHLQFRETRSTTSQSLRVLCRFAACLKVFDDGWPVLEIPPVPIENPGQIGG